MPQTLAAVLLSRNCLAASICVPVSLSGLDQYTHFRSLELSDAAQIPCIELELLRQQGCKQRPLWDRRQPAVAPHLRTLKLGQLDQLPTVAGVVCDLEVSEMARHLWSGHLGHSG